MEFSNEFWFDGELLAERIINEEEETSIRLDINRTLEKGAVKLLSDWILKEIEK